MNVTAAFPIQSGPSAPLAGAPVGGGAAFAALIGGGAFRPLPVLVTGDVAASGGQAGAVIGSALPLEAPEMGPDILVVAPTGASTAANGTGVEGNLRQALPIGGSIDGAVPALAPADPAIDRRGSDIPLSGAVPLTMPDLAPDILVEQRAPVTAVRVSAGAPLSDAAPGGGSAAGRFRFAKAMPTLVARDRTTTTPAPGDPSRLAASIPTETFPAAAPEDDAKIPALSDDPALRPGPPPIVVGSLPLDPLPSVAVLPTPLEAAPDRRPLSHGGRPIDTSLPSLPAAPAIAPSPPVAPSVPQGTVAPAITAPSPSRPDDEPTVLIQPNRGIDQSRQRISQAKGPAPLAVGAASLADLPPPLLASPVVAPLSAGAIAPAGALFADAIHAAGRLRFDPSGDVVPISQVSTTTPIAAALATGDNTDRPLDLAHPGWPGAMIEHIERLRDAADAVDTRIRLVPDALGGIDVSLRRHDDGVRVTLAADRPETQAILVEARPRLDAMAEVRGIRLADAAPSGSAAGGFVGGDPSSAHRQPRPAAFTPAAPASATATDTLDPANGRVA